MTPNSSQTSYVLPADMIKRHDPRLMAQLVSYNPFQPVIYAPYGPTILAGTASLVQSSNIVAFSNPQSGIPGSTFTVGGDSSAQTYIFMTSNNGNPLNFTFSPVYGGSSTNSATVTVVPTDTLSNNENFLEALNAASGELESACLRASIYKVIDLQSLTGVSLSYLKKIVSNIAMMLIYTMRDGPAPSEMVTKNYNDAMDALQALSEGKQIFAFSQTEQAGLPTVYRMQPYNQIQNRMVSSTWRRSFGIRQNMINPWGGGFGGGGGFNQGE